MASRSAKQAQLDLHVQELWQCRRCPRMIPPPVSGGPISSKVMLVGQAPGVKEPVLARPFARSVGAVLPRLWSVPGHLARENAQRNPRRTAATASALMVGLALVSAFSILGAVLYLPARRQERQGVRAPDLESADA